ncbi:radical SAM/SPASM domain-containing protein [Elizabethkingia sp. JS20170427COW]|uniref:radical SAM/SPASM domain-containing protein n=1 Tax=Elizabethkingia sp. JS20170427COW TaxID=2583851 RepID=UPI001110D5E8|nr:radical SAM protein [Elizabethkingia sp. JS20170427COW]QCX52494.1 radical SAM protein [Elizabethkingia sp. JS20170427COW]
MFIAGLEHNNIDDLNEIHEDFYNFMINKKFLVDNDFDELDYIKELQKTIDNNESSYHLVINPTMNCNFKCWYCYESHIKDSKMSIETMSSIKAFIYNIINNPAIEHLHISWFGGEPLLYFDTIKEVLKYTKEEIQNLENITFDSSFTTNGLLISDEIIDFCMENNAIDYQITLDGDQLRHDSVRFISKNKGSYHKIVRNILKIAEKGFIVNIRINISKETIDGLQNIADDFAGKNGLSFSNIVFSFQKVWQEKEEIDDEINEAIKYFRTLGFKVKYIGIRTDTLRRSCYADKVNQATINYNGEVFKCTARDFNNENKEGDLDSKGNILWNEKQHTRLNSKFKNKPCLSCKILPICNGGCSQNALENVDTEYCVFNFDENKKQDVIYQKFLEKVIYV